MSKLDTPITGMDRSRAKLDMQETLEDACKETNGKACITGDSAIFYVDSSSPECRNATVKVGDSYDAVFAPKIYEAICSGQGNCLFDKNKPIGSACIADKNVMSSVRATLGVKGSNAQVVKDDGLKNDDKDFRKLPNKSSKENDIKDFRKLPNDHGQEDDVDVKEFRKLSSEHNKAVKEIKAGTDDAEVLHNRLQNKLDNLDF